jgi:hypothetical protein
MTIIINHTPHIVKQIVELIIVSLVANIVRGANCKYNEPQSDPSLPYKAFTLFLVRQHSHSFIYSHLWEGITFLFEFFGPMHNLVACLNVNVAKTSHAYKYAITSASSCTTKAPSPSSSMSIL